MRNSLICAALPHVFAFRFGSGPQYIVRSVTHQVHTWRYHDPTAVRIHRLRFLLSWTLSSNKPMSGHREFKVIYPGISIKQWPHLCFTGLLGLRLQLKAAEFPASWVDVQGNLISTIKAQHHGYLSSVSPFSRFPSSSGRLRHSLCFPRIPRVLLMFFHSWHPGWIHPTHVELTTLYNQSGYYTASSSMIQDAYTYFSEMPTWYSHFPISIRMVIEAVSRREIRISCTKDIFHIDRDTNTLDWIEAKNTTNLQIPFTATLLQYRFSNICYL